MPMDATQVRNRIIVIVPKRRCAELQVQDATATIPVVSPMLVMWIVPAAASRVSCVVESLAQRKQAP